MLLFGHEGVALALLIASAAAIPVADAGLLDSRGVGQCTTTYGSTSCRASTYRHTSTVTATCKETRYRRGTVTVTPYPVVVTGPPVTSTVETTATAITPTITESVPYTSTITLPTSTAESVVTQTETATSTTTPTTVVDAGVGFVPLQTSLPGTTDTYQGTRRDAYQARMRARAILSARPSRLVSKNTYPKRIDCTTVRTVTSTSYVTVPGAKTTVTASAATVTAPNAQTITITSTIVPPNASAVTVTSTLTQFTTASPTTTTTRTQTVTNTQTVIAPQYTDYAQCRPNNFGSVYLGRSFANFQWTNEADAIGQGQAYSSANSARECCIQCLKRSDCANGAFFPDAGNFCFIETHTNCNAYNQYPITVNYDSNPTPSQEFFNGNCGTAVLAQMLSS